MIGRNLIYGAVAAAVLAAAPAAAQERPGSAKSGVRSAQALPSVEAQVAHRPSSSTQAQIASAAADPPYCSGNKKGIYAGNGQKNGNGLALTCAAASPG